MQETRKTKDMVISIICITLSILSIVFYFLPAFSIRHSVDGGVYTTQYYSGFDITRSLFTNTTVLGSQFQNMLEIRDLFTYQTFLSGIMLPLGIIASVATAVFTTLAWLKDEKFKQFAFLTSICDMFFVTVSLIATWLIVMSIHSGVEIGNLYNNKISSMGIAAFAGLILAFVIAIVACAYYYFLDGIDVDEDDDEEEVAETDEDEEKEPQNTEDEEKPDILTEELDSSKNLAYMMESGEDIELK